MRVVFGIDVDWRIDKMGWIDKFIETRKAILKALGFRLVDVIVKPSPSKRGLHIWFHCEGRPVDDYEKNMIHFMLGDDPVRCMINMIRIERGVKKPFILFSKVLWTEPPKGKCKKCKLRKAVESLREQFLENL